MSKCLDHIKMLSTSEEKYSWAIPFGFKSPQIKDMEPTLNSISFSLAALDKGNVSCKEYYLGAT